MVQPTISLSLAVAHDFGAIWEMKWCPSGAYQPNTVSEDEVSTRTRVSLRGTHGHRHMDRRVYIPPLLPPSPSAASILLAPAPQNEDVLPRLGLLACACSDGTIRIFSVPHPETIHGMIKKQLDKDDFISVCRVSWQFTDKWV